MNMRIGSLRHWSPWLLALAAAAAPAPAQQDPTQQDPEAMERLRRDQEEILRKAERLHGMMQRLQQRYEREQKPEQVKLLQEGVAHLERSGEVCESSREFVHESTIREGPPTEMKPDGNETRKWGRFLGEWKR